MKEKLAAIAEIKAEKQKQQADRDEETNRSGSTTISSNTKELSPQIENIEKPVGSTKLSKKDSSDWGNDASSEDSRDSSKGSLLSILMNN